MAMEPERPIEKLLRACAKERRDQAGAPLELHAATRRLLQGEVARQFARKKHGPDTPFRRLVGLWPRLAWSLGALAALTAVVWLSLPSKNQPMEEARLAKNERPLFEPAPVQTPAEARGQADSSGSAVNRRADLGKAKEAPDAEAGWKEVSKDRAPAKSQAAGGEMPNLPAQAPAESLKQEARVPAVEPPAPGSSTALKKPIAPEPQLAAVPTVAATTPAAPPPSSAPGTSVAAAAKQPITMDQLRDSKEKRAAQSELDSKSFQAAGLAGLVSGLSDFTNSIAFNKSGTVVPQAFVLASFRMEQSGQKLRVIDGDGSVYTGYLEATNYFFHVAGTNRSLNQKVVFTGTLLPATNAATVASSTNRSRRNAGGLPSARAERFLSPAPAAPDTLPLRNSRISGKAVLANGQEFEINAVPQTNSR